MQPPPQHPSIRARNVLRTAEPLRPPPVPIVPSLSAEHDAAASASEPVLAIEAKGALRPPLAPQHGDSSGRNQSDSQFGIAKGLRTSLSATLAAPPTVHTVSGSQTPVSSRPSSPRPTVSLPHSPGLTRTATSGSLDASRPGISLYGLKGQDQDVSVALEELQQLELEDFLQRMSKSMEEVNFADPAIHVQMPTLSDFVDKRTGRTDYFGFAERWACSFADTRLPRDLVTSTRPDKFSFSRTRTGLERLYVLLPPALLEKILAGDLVKLYRWHDPLITAKWALVRISSIWECFVGLLTCKTGISRVLVLRSATCCLLCLDCLSHLEASHMATDACRDPEEAGGTESTEQKCTRSAQGHLQEGSCLATFPFDRFFSRNCCSYWRYQYQRIETSR